jgi:hypothetical protein
MPGIWPKTPTTPGIWPKTPKSHTTLAGANDQNYRYHPAHQNKTVGFGQRPRPLHNRYTRTDNFVRWGMAVTYSRYKIVTVSLPKRFRNGRFTSETAVRRFQK